MTSLKYYFIVHMVIHLPKNDISKCNRDTIRPRLFHMHESKFTPCCPTNARNIPRFKAGIHVVVEPALVTETCEST